MRVLIVSKALVIAMYRKKLSELVSLGVEVIAVTPPAWNENGRAQILEPSDDPSYELLVSPVRWNGHFHIHHFPELPAIIRRTRPDIVHLDDEPYNAATYLGVRAAGRARVPSLFFAWQNISRRYPPPFGWMERSVFGGVAHGLAGTAEAESVLRNKGFLKPVTVVPQFGVDPDAFFPIVKSDRVFTIGFLNRLVPAKAPHLTLRALSHMSDDARLLIVGDGPLRRELEREIENPALRSRVELRPRVPSAEMPALMRCLDVVVLPSLTTRSWKEQFGRVLIEAMASGVAVVGSDSGEIPRVVGDAGLIVPEGDEAALADALQRLRDDPDLRRDLASRGRYRAVSCFSQRKVAETTLEAYREVMA